MERPVNSNVCGFCISEDKREEILTGNILLTEKRNPRLLNEIVTLVRSLVVFYTKWRILTLAYIKQKMVAWNIYKRKNIRDVRK